MLFFDRKPAQEKPWTRKLWTYDLRTNQHFTLKERTLKRPDLDEFVACYNTKDRTSLPAPEVIAADITADLEAALEQFAAIAEDLK